MTLPGSVPAGQFPVTAFIVHNPTERRRRLWSPHCLLGFTTWVRTGDVLPLSVELPPYWALIEWEPVERLETERTATPLELSDDEPSVVLPSRNFTVPVGVPDDAVTLAVKVT